MLEIEELLIELGTIKVDIPYLKIESGDYAIIMGPTGAGKTVLLETIAGFYKPSRGKIILNGMDITREQPNKRKISLVYQDYMLFPHMTSWENVIYPLKIRGEKDYNYARELGSLLEIENIMDRYPKTLSGGEMQRVALARALSVKPEVIFLDEPFSALDEQTKSKVRKIVKYTLNEINATVVHITHDLETARIMGTKLAIMHQGKLVQYGDINEVISNPNTEFIAKFMDSNILRGEVVGHDNTLTVIKSGDIKIYMADKASGKVSVSISPENIILSRNKIESSMRNELSGKIVKIENSGRVERIYVKVGNTVLVSLLTPNAVNALSLETGIDVYVYFKASNVRVL